MAYLGHPLAGDDLYGGKRDHIARQALHCCALTFTHPVTKEMMHFSKELPEDIASFYIRPVSVTGLIYDCPRMSWNLSNLHKNQSNSSQNRSNFKIIGPN